MMKSLTFLHLEIKTAAMATARNRVNFRTVMGLRKRETIR
jgi:hypothetical protein